MYDPMCALFSRNYVYKKKYNTSTKNTVQILSGKFVRTVGSIISPVPLVSMIAFPK